MVFREALLGADMEDELRSEEKHPLGEHEFLICPTTRVPCKTIDGLGVSNST